ncbi:MAG: glutamyl-tRNA reductase [Gemmatimonadota bacterium]
MELFVVGTSQSVAPTRVRERMHVDLDEVYATLGSLLTERGVVEEAIPLATCGRLELYCVAREPERALKVLVRLLGRRTGVPSDELRTHIYALKGQTAVRHLFRVASGLDSVVHGEAQILGQVRAAAHHPLSMTSKGPVLHRMFEMALATGKKVRTETDIGRGAASLASASLRMVERDMGSLARVRALVIGAGETGALMARLLGKAGVASLVVANRTEDTAREVARPLGGAGAGLDRLPELLHDADLVVGAVTAGEWLVTAEMIQDLDRSLSEQPMRFLDLAHPRNFDPALSDIPGVQLFDLDHVFERVEAARAARAAQVPRAEAIVREQAEVYSRWFRSRDSVEVLKAVRRQVLDLARSEAERFGQGRSDEEKEQMRLLARSLARTLLHQPTLALRDADPDSPEGRFMLEAAPALFGVDADREDTSESN